MTFEIKKKNEDKNKKNILHNVTKCPKEYIRFIFEKRKSPAIMPLSKRYFAILKGMKWALQECILWVLLASIILWDEWGWLIMVFMFDILCYSISFALWYWVDFLFQVLEHRNGWHWHLLHVSFICDAFRFQTMTGKELIQYNLVQSLYTFLIFHDI